MFAVLQLSTEISNTTGSSNEPETPLWARVSEKPAATESLCWNQAKAQFREKHVQTVSGVQKNELEKHIERFLKNNNRLDETISECRNLKSTADRQYSHTSGSSKFIKKLLDVLVVVKSVGDPLLQCAPESVSVTWSMISLLIGLGANDLDNCGRISEACTSIVTIVLNCRLYENRYQNSDASSRIITSVQQLLSTILDFFWFANKKLRDSKIKRLFKNIFDQTTNEIYQDVITRYKVLREDADLAFQEKVVESLDSLQTQLEQEMKKDKAEIIKYLFPPLQDIASKLEDLADATKDALTEAQVNTKFEKYRKDLNPTKTHLQQLEATTEPLPRGTDHLCKWLFEHQQYQSWERPPSKARLEKEPSLEANPGGRRPSLMIQGPEVVPSPNVAKVANINLFYVKGEPGFGKSVMMAAVVKRLQAGMHNGTNGDAPPYHTGIKEVADKYPVLFFFFKRGDDATQLTSRAFSSLVTQLFDDQYAKTKEEKEKFMMAIDFLRDSALASNKDSLVGRTDPESKEENPPTTSNKDLLKVEAMAREINKTVYIIIDGIDECTNYESEGLVSELIKLGRSKKANFKIIMSSRLNLDLEPQFAKNNDAEAQNKFTTTTYGHGRDLESGAPFYCVTHDDTTILTLTKETNSDDMKEYLRLSLQKLMERRTPEISHPRGVDPHRREGNKRSKKKLEKKIADNAEIIQRKSEGMFTYSAMAITNLGQPSPLTLKERLENLPPGMNSLYSKQLDALTGAERTLVMLTLKRIMWSPTDMGTVEIVEEFKNIYLGENGPVEEEDIDSEDDIVNPDSESIDGSISREEDLEDTEDSNISKPFQVCVSQSGDQSGTRPLLRRAETYPGENIIENSIRNPEIFDTIFHLGNAGRDFFKFSKDKQTIGFIHKSVRDWFEEESKEAAKSDHAIPSIASLFSRDRVVIKGRWDSGFQSEKDAQLDILLYTFRVLAHPRFQNVYLPDYEPVENLEENKNLTRSSDIHGAVPEGGGTLDTNRQGLENDIRPAPNSEPSSEPEIPTSWRDTEPEDSDTCRDESSSNFDEGGPKTFHEGPWRCEIHQWIHHMKRIGELWPRGNAKEREEAQEVASDTKAIDIAGLLGLEVLMEFLIAEPDADANLQKLPPSNRTPLNHLEILYFPETVNIVLQRDIDIGIKSEDNETVFTTWFTASELNQHPVDRGSERYKNLAKTLEYLVAKGVDVNQRLNTGLRPLQALIEIGDENLFELVMGTGNVDVDLRDTHQRTALHTIWKSPGFSPHAQKTIAQKLLDAGADPNAQDRESRAPLLQAVLSRNSEGVELLLKIEGKDKVNINDEDNYGWTALTAIVRDAYGKSDHKEEIKLIKLLLEHNADVGATDKTSWTTFRHAVYFELWDITDILMAHSKEKGVDNSYLTQKDIYVELEDPNLDFAIYLLGHGANPYATNSKGKSIGDTAFESWMKLRSRPNERLEPILGNWTKLYLATSQPTTDINNMFLHHAISVGNKNIIQQLAEAGIDPLKKDSENWDAFDWAYACNRQDIIKECFPNIEVDYQLRIEEWKDTFNLITGWDPERSRKGLQLLETDNVFQLAEDSEELKKVEDVDCGFATLTKYPISPYIPEFYYEITILTAKEQKNSLVGIGLAGNGIPLGRFPGWPHLNIATYGFHGDVGCLYNSGVGFGDRRELETGAQSYGTGDTVGCGYDTLSHSIFWTLNGNYLGIGIRGVCHRLYPMVATKDWFSASANFGNDPNKPFKWNGSREMGHPWTEISIIAE
ncbi:hypothetical protein TWF106_011538 [Orbilia oligospora]|uniref:B30.2/SPRY domain-containing protein n=1 Tax=Orbilia oligospora TaxID=2813651 RepID=A0A7C8UG34_ORBOL|nr:hypothetical protein TWF106_011538 [Orbilia oligospora]